MAAASLYLAGVAAPTSYSYRAAGVDIEAGNALVRRIGPLARSTARPGAEAQLGGFGGLFDLKAAGFRDPLLVAANDGVGTKLKLAIELARHEGIGIDLVAMSVNDLIVQGAEPLFFLDYFATSKLDPQVAETVIEGIAYGCRISGCALIGGETAEMPGLYAQGDYDLAGFCVGAVEREALLDGSRIKEGDRLLGLASSGVHSNGFSLVRRLAADRGWRLDAPAPFDETVTLGEALLAPTRIYVAMLGETKAGRIAGLAHITGGGLLENVPRVLPPGLEARIDAGSWPWPPLFAYLRNEGNIEAAEMARTFNNGIGMVAIVDPAAAAEVSSALAQAGERVFDIGEIGEGESGCRIDGQSGSWGVAEDWTATLHG